MPNNTVTIFIEHGEVQGEMKIHKQNFKKGFIDIEILNPKSRIVRVFDTGREKDGMRVFGPL